MKMLIERMDNDVDLPPDLTDRARLTSANTNANANELARRALRCEGPPEPTDPAVDTELDPDMMRSPKRLPPYRRAQRLAPDRNGRFAQLARGAARAAEAREGAA